MKRVIKLICAAVLALIALACMVVCACVPETAEQRATESPCVPQVVLAKQRLAPDGETAPLLVMVNEVPEAEQEPIDEPARVLLGTFRVTAYCPCEKCCGKEPGDPAYGITASGTHVKEGRTIAADPNVLPFGTVIYINDHPYTVEDTGSAIREDRLDLYFDSHQTALEWGVQYVEVWADAEAEQNG